jgi:hypothetical protein
MRVAVYSTKPYDEQFLTAANLTHKHHLSFLEPFHYFIMAAYAVAIVLVFFAPKYIIALAFDLGGVTTSEVTVPLVTALGIGLAAAVEGRDVLIDGFGLIAFASVFPVIAVMVMERASGRCFPC